MFSVIDTQCLAVLQAATAATLGIRLRTNNPTKCRQVIYRVRKDFGDATMEEITIRVSPDDVNGELWLLRRSAANAVSASPTSDPIL